jgi:hypothetical protein
MDALPWHFPSGLTTLSLNVHFTGFVSLDVAAGATNLMSAIGSLRQLVNLRLTSTQILPFESLLELTQLRRLEVSKSSDVPVLRKMRQLHELAFATGHNASLWRRLLSSGNQLQLRTACIDHASPVECEMLVSMPTLTDLTLDNFQCSYEQFAFFGALPQLTRLQMAHPTCTSLAASLSQHPLVHLTELRIKYKSEWGGGGDGEDEMLEKLPQLRILDLRHCKNLNRLSSRFIRSGNINRSLTSLSIKSIVPRLTINELSYLLALQALESLTLINVFERNLDDEEYKCIKSTMPLLRSLTLF